MNFFYLFSSQLCCQQVVLNSLGNYIAKAWSTKHGCASCQDNRISLDGLKVMKSRRVIDDDSHYLYIKISKVA